MQSWAKCLAKVSDKYFKYKYLFKILIRIDNGLENDIMVVLMKHHFKIN